MPPNAVSVTRPGKYGNPFPVETFGRAFSIVKFRRYVLRQPDLIKAAREELRGKDLACWCSLEEPLCHADIWLEIANV